jgi:pimeloyl-ACP methyl ester carboxylesterase
VSDDVSDDVRDDVLPDGPAELELVEALADESRRVGRGRAALLPLGERLELPGRGRTFVRRVQGPPGAPTVVLLHGWIASGGLNWFQAFAPLGEVATVLAPDLRGHGRGLRSRRRFRLADCADDVAAMCEQLATGPIIAVGYSMGGPVAQLLWKRHPHLVEGLVLVATADHFVPTVRARLIFTTLMSTAASTSRLGAVVGHLPRQLAMQVVPYTGRERPDRLSRWAGEEMRRHDLRLLFEAGAAIGSYDARRWIGQVDVPTAVVVTRRDRAVTPSQQAAMAFRIDKSLVHQIDDGHLACAAPSFGRHLVEAVQAVAAERAGGSASR